MALVTLVLNAAFITVAHGLTIADSIAQNAEKDWLGSAETNLR